MPQTPRPPDAASTAGSGCSPAQPAEAADGMFYSHQLLARKASLGQIYCVPFPPFPSAPSSPASATRSRPPATDCACPAIAATFKAKINRRRLDKLDIIKIW
ncbi:hypothetical protein D1007_14123 [Hordeum vulgare]|nr:hypothetical protein D1007_14123 [Hordeum vulgare]